MHYIQYPRFNNLCSVVEQKINVRTYQPYSLFLLFSNVYMMQIIQFRVFSLATEWWECQSEGK